MKNIINHITNRIEGVEITLGIQGGVEIQLQDIEGVAAALSCIADMLYEYDSDEDIQITTNLSRYSIYIEPLDREEFEDED